MNGGRWAYLAAVDGGGTGCRVRLCAPDGRMLAEAGGGPANVTTDPALALASLGSAVSDAAAAAGLAPDDMTRTVARAGIAGILTRADIDIVSEALPFGAVQVSDDRETSVVGALGGRDGAVVAVGTGSFVALRRAEALRGFGGWGLAVGDQASGGWLGRAALEHCLLVRDGLATASDLTRALMAEFDDDPIAVVRFASTARPADFAAHAPRIAAAAEAGDELGVTLMERGAAYLTRCLDAAGFGENDVLCLTGGLGPAYAPYLTEAHRARVAEPEGSALDGGIRLAQRQYDRLTRRG